MRTNQHQKVKEEKSNKNIPVAPLGVCVNVELDDAVGDGLGELSSGGARAAVEHEEAGVLILEVVLLANVLLAVAENRGLEHHVAGLVHAVHVTEGSGNVEAGRDLAQGRVHKVDVLGGGVELVLLDVLVVDTVLLATGDTNLHLERLFCVCVLCVPCEWVFWVELRVHSWACRGLSLARS